jgi:hypothetical protein
MDVRVFYLPNRSAGIDTIEKCLQELKHKARNGAELDEVEVDWMDAANTWLVMEDCLAVDNRFK